MISSFGPQGSNCFVFPDISSGFPLKNKETDIGQNNIMPFEGSRCINNNINVCLPEFILHEQLITCFHPQLSRSRDQAKLNASSRIESDRFWQTAINVNLHATDILIMKSTPDL